MQILRGAPARLLLALVAAGVLLAPACAVRAAAQGPAVLTRADITYACTIPIPRAVDGQDTLYRTAGLALRRVGDAVHAFTSIGGDIVEFRVPDACGAPLVFVKNHGRIWKMAESEPQAVTTLHFRQLAPDGTGQLWVVASYFYHVTGNDDPHVSVATFTGATYTGSSGPYALSGPGVTYNKTRSGLTGWVNDSLLIGAGGHFAGVSTASLGLFAGVLRPLVLGGTGLLGVVPLVDHPYLAAQGFPTSASRMGDYSSAGLPTSPDAGTWPQPSGGVGKWQYYDGIDAFAYLNTGAKHGLIAVGQEATGPITYDAGGACAACIWREYWRIYDPLAIAGNAGKPLEPASYWRVAPGEMGDPNYGRALNQHKDGQNLPLATGLAFDAPTRRLFFLHGKLTPVPGGFPYELTAGVMVYRIGPAPEPPPPPPPPPPVVWPGEVRSKCTRLVDGSCNYVINLPGTAALAPKVKVEVRK